MWLSKILGVPFRSVFSINCPTKFTKPAPQIMHSPSSQFSPKNPTSGRAIHSNSSPAEKAGCGVSVTIPNAVQSRHYIYTIQFTHQKIHACLPLAGQSAARQAPLQHTIKKSAQIRLTRSIGVPFQHPTKKSAPVCRQAGSFSPHHTKNPRKSATSAPRPAGSAFQPPSHHPLKFQPKHCIFEKKLNNDPQTC